jgi:hypothetical protein
MIASVLLKVLIYSLERASMFLMSRLVMHSFIKRAYPGLRQDLQRLVRSMGAHKSSRSCLNLAYSALPNREKARFHALCCALFTDDGGKLEHGRWTVKFAGKRLVHCSPYAYDLFATWPPASVIVQVGIRCDTACRNRSAKCSSRKLSWTRFQAARPNLEAS